MSYVTGSHSAKFGARFHQNDSTFPKNYYNNAQLKYNFRGGVPYQLTMYADQASDQNQQQKIFAIYAQDRWTLNRLSLQGGLRFEHLGDYFGDQTIGPNIFVPTAVTFAKGDGPLSLNDIQPRFGASYDVFGNGKTAAKFFIGRYVTTTNTVDEWLFYSPAGNGHFGANTNRAWADTNGNFVADCDLLNPAANGECGAFSNPNFGKTSNPLTVDPDTTSGWNKREYSWDVTAGVTQEIAPRVSVEFNYVRRTWGNLKTTINRALTPADFDTFTYNVPTDSRLPGGGGYPLRVPRREAREVRGPRQLPDVHGQHRGILQQLQRRGLQRERTPARRDDPGRHQHRQRRRRRMRRGLAASGDVHLRRLGRDAGLLQAVQPLAWPVAAVLLPS